MNSSDNFFRHIWPRTMAFLSALFFGLASTLVEAAMRMNLQEPASELARDIYDLHTVITWICVIIFVGVFSAMFWSIYAHRKSKGYKAAQFHENVAVEVAWTVIPPSPVGLRWSKPSTSAA